MRRSLFIFTFCFTQMLLIYNDIYSQEVKSIAFTAGININIRQEPSLQSKVIAQSHLGDEIFILDVPENKFQFGNQKQYFYKIKYGNIVGWINRLYVSNKYFKTDKFIVFTVLLEGSGVTNPYCINVYFLDSKQITSISVDVTSIEFTSDLKYIITDKGSSPLRIMKIYELPLLNLIESSGTFLQVEVRGSKVYYKETKKGSKLNSQWTEKVFENGKIKETGEKGIVNEE